MMGIRMTNSDVASRVGSRYSSNSAVNDEYLDGVGTCHLPRSGSAVLPRPLKGKRTTFGSPTVVGLCSNSLTARETPDVRPRRSPAGTKEQEQPREPDGENPSGSPSTEHPAEIG